MCMGAWAPLASLRARYPGLVGAGSGLLGPLGNPSSSSGGRRRGRDPPAPLAPAAAAVAREVSPTFLQRCQLSFFRGGGAPGLEAPRRPATSRRAWAGVARGVGDHPPPAAPMARGAARAAGRRAESGSAAGCPAASGFWDPSPSSSWGGDSRRNPLRLPPAPRRVTRFGASWWPQLRI